MSEGFAGRPWKPIDWDLVDDLLISGCTGTEIAPFFNMHRETFYDRVVKEKGMLFTEYAGVMYEKGNATLRDAQYKKALSGDNTMMVWLGKNRLKQKDNHQDVEVTQSQIEVNKAIVDQITQAQAFARDALKSNRSKAQDVESHTE